MIDRLKEFEKYMNEAYKNSNHFDSQYQIEELKKEIGEKELIKFIKKQIRKRKNNETLFNLEYDKLRKKYLPRSYDLWEDALNWIKHKYRHGEYIYFKQNNEIMAGQINKLTKKGYKVFVGRKLGVIYDVTFTEVICHITNINELKKAIKNE